MLNFNALGSNLLPGVYAAVQRKKTKTSLWGRNELLSFLKQ